jgi:hypothetical protein
MEEERRSTIWIAAALPIDPMPIAYAERAALVRFNWRESRIHSVSGSLLASYRVDEMRRRP